MAALALAAGLHLRPGALRRALVAGMGWGVPVAALIIAREAWACGVLCLTDAAMTLTMSVVTGLLTLGPLAAFGGARPRQ